MICRRKGLKLRFGAAVLFMAAALPVRAGNIDLKWNPAAGTDVAGYVIYYDTQPGPNFRFSYPVANVTSASLPGLNDCTWYYLAVKAVDSTGNLSSGLSNQVEGWPHPVIKSVSTQSIPPGGHEQIVVQGSGFAPGAHPELSGGSLTVSSYTVDSCGQMTLNVTAGPAASGATDLTIVNSDGGFSTLVGALGVSSTFSSFEVRSVTPEPGSTGVDPGAPIHVTFSQPVYWGTAVNSMFRLLRTGGGGRVKIGPEPPVVDASGTTVTLIVHGTLYADQSYTVQVKGGSRGVYARSGAPLGSDYVQPAPFRTTPLIRGVFYGPTGANPVSYAALTEGGTVPPDSVLIVRFTEAMDPVRVNNGTFRLTGGRSRLRLKDGGPVLSQDGLSARLEPETVLPTGTPIMIAVRGAAKGIRSLRGVPMAPKSFTLSFTTAPGAVQGLGVAD